MEIASSDQMSMTIQIIIGFIILIPLSAMLFHYTASYIYDYTITTSGVQIVLFKKIPIARINASDIVEMKEISFKDSLLISPFFTARLGNRMSRTCVLLRTSRWFVRTILITPDNPKSFISDLNKIRLSREKMDKPQ